MRARRLSYVALGAALTIGAAASPISPHATASSCGARHGNWRTTAAPAGLATFEHVGADSGAAYLPVNALDPTRLYARPGKTRVVGSLDGCCAWTTVFSPAALPNQPAGSFYPLMASQYRIFQIVVPHGRAATDGKTVYALATMKPPDAGLTTGVYQGWPIL